MNEPKSRPEHRPRGRPALRTEQETRKMLIDAAREVFLTKGYSGTSVSVVAKHAGMSTRTIYKIIGTKEDLFQLVADDTIETMIADLDGPLAGTTPEEAIFGLGTGLYNLCVESRRRTEGPRGLGRTSKVSRFPRRLRGRHPANRSCIRRTLCHALRADLRCTASRHSQWSGTVTQYDQWSAAHGHF